MDLGLPCHLCTFVDMTMTSLDFRGNPIFMIFFLFEKKNEASLKFTLCKQNKHDNI